MRSASRDAISARRRSTWRTCAPDHLDELYAGVTDFVEDGGTFVEFTASTLVDVAALYEPWCVVEIEAVAVVN